MKQGQFEELYGSTWRQFEDLLAQLEDGPRKSRAKEMEQFAHLYRKVCHFHALAKERNYSSYLVDLLADLIVRGHQHLYQRKYHLVGKCIRFFVADFPRLVRQEYKLFWIASALFYLPSLILGAATVMFPELVYTVLDPSQVIRFENMYNPSHRVIGEARDSASNWMMFGFYIKNNISISFQVFASGLLWCAGTIFFLVFNGLYFGAVAGLLINVGYSETFFTFVVAHASFEVTAIVIAGAAGFKLGLGILCPGNLTRGESLKRAAHVAIQLVYGVIAMLVIAAFVEAFWSSNNVFSPWQKYLVGAFFWLVVACYLMLSGRRGTR